LLRSTRNGIEPQFFADFAKGSGDEFKRVVAAYEANPNKFKGFGALPQ
jgi:hypothetical protein